MECNREIARTRGRERVGESEREQEKERQRVERMKGAFLLLFLSALFCLRLRFLVHANDFDCFSLKGTLLPCSLIFDANLHHSSQSFFRALSDPACHSPGQVATR